MVEHHDKLIKSKHMTPQSEELESQIKITPLFSKTGLEGLNDPTHPNFKVRRWEGKEKSSRKSPLDVGCITIS